MVDSAYDPTRNFCDSFLAPWGVETTYYDPRIGGEIASLIRPNTAAIFMESPGSLTFEVQDVPAIVAVAKAHGIRTLIDNTWATSLNFQGLAHGVDLIVTAATKYLCGHSDVMMGAVTSNAACWMPSRRTAQMLGHFVSADDSFLVLRGMRTLPLRMKQHGESTLKIAAWLEGRPEVAQVLYPALPSHDGHDIWTRDFAGAGGLFSFVLNGGDDAARTALMGRPSRTASMEPPAGRERHAACAAAMSALARASCSHSMGGVEAR
jgi:cystathionine beta-lyase